jgi:hypothetical protein
MENMHAMKKQRNCGKLFASAFFKKTDRDVFSKKILCTKKVSQKKFKSHPKKNNSSEKLNCPASPAGQFNFLSTLPAFGGERVQNSNTNALCERSRPPPTAGTHL